MPESIYQLPAALAAIPAKKRDLVTKASWGPIMWRQLHDRPQQAADDLSREREWIEGFRAAIFCEACRWHFTQYLSISPPDFTSAQTYFRWSWSAHNAVRRRQGKPMVPWNPEWGSNP